MFRLCAVFGPVLGVVLIGFGCHSPKQRVGQKLDGLRIQWRTNVEHQSNLVEKRLDWPSALALATANNLDIRQARVEVTNSQEAVRQIFNDLIPTLNLRSGISKRAGDFSTTTLDDVTFSADSFFNIPGLISFGARLYAARLYQFRAETALALKKRQKAIELYKLFLEADEKHSDAAHLQSQKTTAEAIREVDPVTGQIMLTELELRQLGFEREAETVQQRASDLLGSRDYRWAFDTNGLPELRYDEDPISLTDTNRVGRLHLTLMAVELEAARAQLTGIKMRYWPELNVFISGPPIYQRAVGAERFFDAADIRASADLFWYLDTRGHISRQLRQTKRQQAILQERMRQESIALIDRLLHTKELIHASRQKAEQVDRNLMILKAVPPAQNFFSLQKYAEDYRALVEQQRQLRREIAELNTLFWFVDEFAWPQPKTLQVSAAKPVRENFDSR